MGIFSDLFSFLSKDENTVKTETKTTTPSGIPTAKTTFEIGQGLSPDQQKAAESVVKKQVAYEQGAQATKQLATINKVQSVVEPVKKTTTAITNFAGDVARAVPRAITSAAIEPTAGILSRIIGKTVEPKFTPSTPTQKFLLGSEPIQGIQKTTGEAQKTTAGILSSLGLNPDVASGASLIGAPILMAGTTALDLIPFGGEAKTAIKNIAKSKSAEEIFTLAKPLLGELADAEKKQIAEELVNITDPKKVADFILQKTADARNTLEEAKKYKSAEEFVNSKTKDWSSNWILNSGKSSPPPFEVISKLSEFKPSEPVTLYRGIKSDSPENFRSGIQAWTKDKSVAEEFAKGLNMKGSKPGRVISRVFSPDDIITDISKIPDNYINDFVPKDFRSEGEILVKGTDFKAGSKLTDIWNKAQESTQPSGILSSVAKQAPEISKERGFAKAIQSSPDIAPELQQAVGDANMTYKQLSNEEIINTAKQLVAEDPAKATATVLSSKIAAPQDVATGIELMRHFQESRRFSEAVSVADNLAEKLTTAGQTVQAAKILTHLSPEGILLKAQNIVKEANASAGRFKKVIELNDETAGKLYDLSKQMQDAAPDLKIELAQDINGILNTIEPPSIGKKLSSLQTITQLFNPKTILVRNPLGNEIFYRLERVNKYVTAPIDWANSAITGADRTVTFHTANQGEYWKNWIKGAKAGWKGVNPEGIVSQFDIKPAAFSGKWNPLTYLEKAMGASLKSFDYAAYSRAKNETIGELAWLQAKNMGLSGAELKAKAAELATNVSDNILQIADDYGKYVTFQDNNVLSNTLSKLKKGLNFGKEFGLGDMVLKYPKTPGALIMRALDYSPAGFLRSAYLLGEAFTKGQKPPVRDIELALSRAITGSLGLTGMGYYLADKGIISGERNKDIDVENLKKQIGSGQYKVNIDALSRFVNSGFKYAKILPGDTLYTYDWAQPVALALSIGANANQNMLTQSDPIEKGTLDTAAQSLASGLDTIENQPVLKGVKDFFGTKSLSSALLTMAENVPSSFTPSVLNQVRQTTDNKSRETYDPKMMDRIVNKIKSRLPVLASTLPQKYTTLGKEQIDYENPSLFNIFLNPSFVSTYKPTPAAALVLDIYSKTGETKQFPRTVPKSLTFYGKDYQLSGEQMSKFQNNLGDSTNAIFTELANNKNFVELPADKQTELLNRVLSSIYEGEKLKSLTKEQKVTLIKSLNEKQQKDFVSKLKSASKYLNIQSPSE